MLGQAQFGPQQGPALIANGYTDLVALRTDDVNGAFGARVFSPPGERDVYFYSGLVLRGNRLFVGDNAGRLLIIDPTTWSVLDQTPAGGGAVYTTPVVSGPAGAETVLYAPYGPGTAEVRTLDVASGTIAVLATGQTAVAAMSGVGADGTLYVAGAQVQVDAGLGQVFALRMDTAAAAAHDLIAESQLLQDYDEPTGGKLTAVARYQTHLTVVDDAGSPRPFTDLRVWAEAPVTVQVDGRPFPIGPQTPAPVRTAADGSLAIVSDAGDLAATPLRVWASFMDPAERVVVYPDAEFHQRLAAAVAQPGGDDPVSINLSTAKSYAGTALFSNQAQAQQMAQVVRQLAGAAGLGGGGGSGLRAPAFAQTGTAGRTFPTPTCPGWPTSRPTPRPPGPWSPARRWAWWSAPTARCRSPRWPMPPRLPTPWRGRRRRPSGACSASGTHSGTTSRRTWPGSSGWSSRSPGTLAWPSSTSRTA